MQYKSSRRKESFPCEPEIQFLIEASFSTFWALLKLKTGWFSLDKKESCHQSLPREACFGMF